MKKQHSRDNTNILWLEDILKNSNEIYFNMYCEMKEYVSEKLLPHIPTLCTWYTDHGINHCNSIIQTLGEMINEQSIYTNIRNDTFDIGQSATKLTIEDVFVLLSSCLWHDVGMLYGRKEHARNLINYSAQLKQYLKYDETFHQLIYNICCSHSSEGDRLFNQCTNYRPLRALDKRVNVAEKTLASLLRFADEISEDRTRVTKEKGIFNEVPAEQKIFWEHCASIEYSGYTSNCIEIVYSIDIKKLFKKYKVGVTNKGRAKNKTLYQFIIERICKLLNEMILLSPHYRDLVKLDYLNITIKVQEQKNWVCTNTLYTVSEKLTPFLSEANFKEFTLRYPKFSQENIKFELEKQV